MCSASRPRPLILPRAQAPGLPRVMAASDYGRNARRDGSRSLAFEISCACVADNDNRRTSAEETRFLLGVMLACPIISCLSVIMALAAFGPG